MKKLLLIFIFLGVINCDKKEEVIIDYDDITIVDGIVYLKLDMSLVTGKINRLHKNGQLFMEATVKDGKRNGVYKRWHENGELNLEATYKDGELISQKKH